MNGAWVLLGILSLGVAIGVTEADNASLSASYWLVVMTVRYLVYGFLVTSRTIPTLLIQRLGEVHALKLHDTFVGLLFFHQGLAASCMASLGRDPILASGASLPFGVALVAIGLGVKFWATALVGCDAYYYHDLFLNRAVGEYVRTGPYRYLSNPMYSVGQLHAYGLAIILGSVPGLVAATAGHLLVGLFYRMFEQPFVRRTFELEP
jgi:protein-S-isoprenylcysteine O-methyltransferase Ste14